MKLSQNFPNPFNPTTEIAFALAEAGPVTLKLFDIAGREVMTLLDTEMPAGRHSLRLDARDLASGSYFYRLASAGETCLRRLVLLK